MQELVITAVGPDRPGLVDELTGTLLDLGANLADSRMVNLGGQFALMLLVQCSAEQTDKLEQRLKEVESRLGMVTSLVRAGAGQRAARPGMAFRLRAYAMDQPGIVHRITHVLHRHNVNIEELQTHLDSGAHSGAPLFNLDLRMTVPPSVAVKALRAELVALCDALNCDVSVEPV